MLGVIRKSIITCPCIWCMMMIKTGLLMVRGASYVLSRDHPMGEVWMGRHRPAPGYPDQNPGMWRGGPDTQRRHCLRCQSWIATRREENGLLRCLYVQTDTRINSNDSCYLQEFLHVPNILSFNRAILHIIVDPAFVVRTKGTLCWLFINNNLMRPNKNNNKNNSSVAAARSK